MKRNIDICLSLKLLELFGIKDKIIVVIDVLRATTAICQAFENGAKEIIPVTAIEVAKEYKSKGFVVAAERDGKVLDFADVGNSPSNFEKSIVEEQIIVYSTVNGVPALHSVKDAKKVIISSFLNLSAVVSYLSNIQVDNILLLCAGWKGNFNLEDTLLAGAIVYELGFVNDLNYQSDSVFAAVNLWLNYKSDLINNANDFYQIKRLRKLGNKDKLEDYFLVNTSNVLPVFQNNIIFDLNSRT